MTTQFHDTVLSGDALAQLFNEARTYNGWLDKPVSDEQLHAIWDLMKMAPTSANMQPVRIIWVKSQEEKDRLAGLASEGNRDKIKAAPVTAIIGYDIDFHEELPWLFPHTDAKSWFDGDEEGRKEGAFRNSSPKIRATASISCARSAMVIPKASLIAPPDPTSKNSTRSSDFLGLTCAIALPEAGRCSCAFSR